MNRASNAAIKEDLMRARLGRLVRCGLVAAVAATTLIATPAHAQPTCAIPEYVVLPDGWTLHVCVDPDSGLAWAYVDVLGGDWALDVNVSLTSLEAFNVTASVDGRRIRARIIRGTDPATGQDTLTLCLSVVPPPPDVTEPVDVCHPVLL